MKSTTLSSHSGRTTSLPALSDLSSLCLEKSEHAAVDLIKCTVLDKGTDIVKHGVFQEQFVMHFLSPRPSSEFLETIAWLPMVYYCVGHVLWYLPCSQTVRW